MKTKKEIKVKKINNSNSIEPLSNTCTLVDYMSPEAFRFFPDKDGWRQRLCYTLHSWSLKVDSLEIQQFCDEFQVPYTTLLTWVVKYEDISAAYSDMKRRIGARRRLGALKNEFNVTAAFKDMNRYDSEWIGLLKEHEDIKKDSGQNTTQVVVLDKFPEEDK